MPHNIFSIPAGAPFAKALAAKLLQDKETLADILILLPTRRACRVLREAFLQLNNGQALLLPRMQPIGDIDEEELSLAIAGAEGAAKFLNLPPSLPPLRRQILLARAIAARTDFTQGFDQALLLAKALGHLMDQIYTEGLDMKDLASLVPEDFADHWQITLDFLKILSEEWPKILQQFGVIDGADRRNRLIESLAAFWHNHPPQGHIIAAGTTGSIPAVAKLLKVVSKLPHGQILLPGLDQNLDQESWDVLCESHPQFGLKQLLQRLDIQRKDVHPWPGTAQHKRQDLSTEIMRPAQTTAAWQGLQDDYKDALQGLTLYECETPQDEAQIIASKMRSILEEPESTAVLITPDRTLAKRVATACLRWGIQIDDSAGRSLKEALPAQFMLHIIAAFEAQFSPVALLTLLKHPLCGISKQEIAALEINHLRGPKPPPGLDGLDLDVLEQAYDPLSSLAFPATFQDIVKAHLSCAEQLCPDIWHGEEGNAISAFFTNLLDHAGFFPDLTVQHYHDILYQLLGAETLRPAYGTHPRLQILGQLEARLIDADLVIMGGLNEGTWPPDPGHDPWMSRPMRGAFGLPGDERSIGLSAHDFVQGFCAERCVITRAKRVDGAPSIPARWLQRMETVLEASNTPQELLKDSKLPLWINRQDAANDVHSCTRPAPKPPVHARPSRVSVTKIETWLKDPYALYAYYVLGVRVLDPLEQDTDAALRGQILHDVLDQFVQAHPDEIPENAVAILQDNFQNILGEYHQNPEDWAFYAPRFAKIADGFLAKEAEWREGAKPLKTEITGEMNIGDFILHGRADRIDQMGHGAAIIDYKSAGTYSKSGMKSGDLPQLPLEALILQAGGFEDIASMSCTYLGYWTLNTVPKFTEIDSIFEVLGETKEGLETLIETFQNPDVPYYASPRADKMLRYNDYDHLSRMREWAAVDEEDAA